MRITPIVAGLAAGAALGLGGVVASELATDNADAQSGGQGLTQNVQSEITSANLRSQRGIKQATTVWNQLGIYLAPEGTQIRAKGPRVSQQKAVGGGLPEQVLSGEVRAKLNSAGPQGPPGPPGPATPAESQTQQRTVRVTENKTLGNSLNRTEVIPELTDAPAGDGYEVTFLATLLMDASSAGDQLLCEFTDGQGTAYGPTQYFTMVGGNQTVTMVGRRGPDAAGLSGVDVTCWSPDVNLFFQDGSLSVISTPVT